MIIINNKSYSGSNVTIRENKVIVDGVDQTPNDKVITISIDGDVNQLNIDHCEKLNIVGNVGYVRSGSGDINCTNITGGAQTGSGDVECETINGNVQTGSGNVKSDKITGSVRTGSGDIKHKN